MIYRELSPPAEVQRERAWWARAFPGPVLRLVLRARWWSVWCAIGSHWWVRQIAEVRNAWLGDVEPARVIAWDECARCESVREARS